MKRCFRFPVLLLWLGLLAGCASYDTNLARGHSLAGVQRYFVISNANDNHAIDQLIATSLRARGCEAETGPLTMLPDEAQAIVSYQDHWTWDFGDHMVYLQISVRDRKTSQTAATVSFSTKVPTRKSPAGIVDGLVDGLFPGQKR